MSLSLNKRYNISFYPVSILGVSYKNAKVISIMDYFTAIKFKNVEQLHREIYPYLPPGTPSDPTLYTFYLLQLEDGSKEVIADYWIINSSITEVTSISKTIKLDNITDSQFSIIRDQMRILGITFTIL